jgi:hypothetical protein
MSDLRQWLSEGVMTPVIWLPVMSVVELTIESGRETDALRHWKGYVRMSEHQCRRVFRHGLIALREFSTLDGERSFRLPETSDDWIITLEDLVILEAERKRMEGKYPGLLNQHRSEAETKAPISTSPVANVIDPTYRIVRVDGQEYRFGEIQAKILRRLADAANAGEPWQSGKVLLSEADSQSFSLGNLFKRNPVWRELIVSNRRGFYRLNERFIDRSQASEEYSESDGRSGEVSKCQ